MAPAPSTAVLWNGQPRTTGAAIASSAGAAKSAIRPALLALARQVERVPTPLPAPGVGRKCWEERP
jgi:hypothetical protein